METKEYEFCSSYVGEFLTIVNYSDDSDDIEMFETYREYALIDLRREFKDSPFYDEYVKEVNDDYDKKIFDFIKEKVAMVSPGFFNEKISSLRKLLMDNSDFASRLGMIVQARKIDDFYTNYKIALQRVAEADFRRDILK